MPSSRLRRKVRVNQRSALFVTTVASTLDAFLVPHARRLRERGWRVDAVAHGVDAFPSLAESFDARFDAEWRRNPLSPGNLLVMTRRIRHIVRDGRYDVVHVHTPVAAFVTRLALRGRGARPVVIYTAHGFHFFRGQRTWPHLLFRSLERLAGRWTDYIVTLTEEDWDAALALGTIPPERVRLIPGVGVDAETYGRPVSPEQLQAVRRELELPHDAFVLCMIAEMGPVKRHEHLFRALALVADPNVVVVLVGSGPLEARLREVAAQLGIEHRLRWAGQRSDVPAVIGASDALVLVSEREGLPRSLLEGMAAGKPIIGTDTRGIRDLALPSAGWIVPKDDAHALAAAIEYAASHPDKVAERGRQARLEVDERYALPLVLAAYEELYDEAVA